MVHISGHSHSNISHLSTSSTLYLVKLQNIPALLYKLKHNEKFVKQMTELGESVTGKSYQPSLEEEEIIIHLDVWSR